MILDSSVDRLKQCSNYMTRIRLYFFSSMTLWVKTLQDELHYCDGAWRCCNSLEGINHSAQLRLAIHHHSSTLNPVQLRTLE